MPDKVAFDGNTSVVLVNDGIVLLDAQADLYSAWKRWCVLTTGGYNREGLKYDPAFRTVAGDPIRSGKNLGAHFFITNNWLIRPYLGDHELVIEGNQWPEPGEPVFTVVTGTATVLATIERAADAYQLVVSGSGGGDGFTSVDRTTLDETHDAVGQFTGTSIVATVPPVITGTWTTEDRQLVLDLESSFGQYTGSAIVATVPPVITGTWTDEDRVLILDLESSLSQFTGSAIVATTPPVITGVLVDEQAVLLEELHYVQGLRTGSPMEVSRTERRVSGIITQSIEEDTPTTGTVRVTRTG